MLNLFIVVLFVPIFIPLYITLVITVWNLFIEAFTVFKKGKK